MSQVIYRLLADAPQGSSRRPTNRSQFTPLLASKNICHGGIVANVGEGVGAYVGGVGLIVGDGVVGEPVGDIVGELVLSHTC